MRLIKHARPFPVATQTRDGERYEDYHPRLAATGLDRPDAPRMDEPLASRRVVDETAALEAGLAMLEKPATPVLRAVADARDAQTRMLQGEVQ
jgi:hypothetical protein